MRIDVALMEGQQFLLVDRGWNWAEHADELWDEAALARHVGVAGQRALVVMVADEYATLASVEMLVLPSAPPPPEEGAWDHVVEVSLQCESGVLQIGAEEAGGAMFALPAPGSYRARVAMAEAGGERPEDAGARYRVELWSAPPEEVRVLRWWPPWKPPRPPTPEPGRRTIHGIDAYRRALRERSLVQVATRDVDPPDHVRDALPPSYREVRLLLRDAEGLYWEYATQAPHHVPVLTEVSLEEARERYGPQVGPERT